MVPCFRKLAAYPGIELLVVARHTVGKNSNFKFNANIVSGINARFLAPEEQNEQAVAKIVSEFKPDIVSLPGWGTPYYRKLAFNPDLKQAKLLMVMDTPRRDTWRQKLGRYRYGKYFARISKVASSGERASQCAKLVGFSEAKICRGAAYGIDYEELSRAYPLRVAAPDGWPKRFLFAGRYHPVKAIDVLLQAYTLYRSSVENPWPLSMCGSGPLEALINSTPGVENLGFVQPTEQSALYARHGAFVLASRFDPWPLVIVEACAAGLPVICTEECGSAVELVRTHYNGLTVPTESVEALAEALRYLHRHHAELPEMGRRSMVLAAPFGADIWARRWIEMIDEVCPQRRLEREERAKI
jgi:glycosyltransferase involved in cell wall biosynthesis